MFFLFFSSIFFLFAICFGLFFVISNALIPGFSETQQQFVYVLELAEANGKDSDQLISQAWDYSLAAMLCVFFCLLTVFLIASLQVVWPLEFLKPPPLSAETKAVMKGGGHDVSIW
jgi:hypothetical protein